MMGKFRIWKYNRERGVASYVVALAIVRICPVRFVEKTKLLDIIPISNCRAGRGEHYSFDTVCF